MFYKEETVVVKMEPLELKHEKEECFSSFSNEDYDLKATPHHTNGQIRSIVEKASTIYISEGAPNVNKSKDGSSVSVDETSTYFMGPYDQDRLPDALITTLKMERPEDAEGLACENQFKMEPLAPQIHATFCSENKDPVESENSIEDLQKLLGIEIDHNYLTNEGNLPNSTFEFCKEVSIEVKPQVCSNCFKTFSEKSSLDKHISLCVQSNNFECQECSASFKKAGHFRRHGLLHNHFAPPREERFVCSNCGHVSKTGAKLRKHIATHTKDRPHKCTKCKEAFKYSQALARHMRIHASTLYNCQHCETSFKLPEYLARHMKTVHMEQKPFECSECRRCFKIKKGLINHMLTHTNQLPKNFTCDRCNKRFRDLQHLRSHIQWHSRSSSHACQECNTKFKDIHTLRRHLLVHSGKRTYECAICEKKFKVKYNLTTHLRVHSNFMPYKCQQCPTGFRHKVSLDNHLIAHTKKNPFNCPKCDESFKTEWVLTQHLHEHS